MPWFFVKDVKKGGLFNCVIENHLVEVVDPDHLKALRQEPDRFQEVATKKEAVSLRAASFTASPELAEEPEVTEDESIIEEPELEPEPVDDEEKPKKKKKKKKT